MSLLCDISRLSINAARSSLCCVMLELFFLYFYVLTILIIFMSAFLLRVIYI